MKSVKKSPLEQVKVSYDRAASSLSEKVLSQRSVRHGQVKHQVKAHKETVQVKSQVKINQDESVRAS